MKSSISSGSETSRKALAIQLWLTLFAPSRMALFIMTRVAAGNRIELTSFGSNCSCL
jgi:hypothetical protein